ncbi:FAT1 [Branchiostoma lanceolatum]|uniref:FAT1 protein n=1 Tax=Branchiostoma lanceolatum TaxID=7740 RepID=A0A8J9ZBS4_BRALA|nr:FAT1 [Branchiostoma lanceolatum]
MEKKIGDELQLKYSIRRNSDPSVYVVNFEAKLCINVTCTETVQILNNLEIPEPVCNASLTDTLGVESVEELEQYVQENGLAAGDVLPPTARETLLNTLGLTHFFEETPCEPPRVLQEGYAGRDSCPDMNNPTLPEAMACRVQSDCLGVSCCVDMDLRLLTLTTTAAVELDICNFTLNLRLGQLNFHQVLFLYQWGSDVTININDTVVVTYSIRQDDAENRFAITLKLRLSIDGQVTAEYYLLRNSFMPQVTCDPNAPMTSLSGQGERSIAGFIQALNITEDTEVGDYAILGLLSYNAIAGVFDLTTSYSPPMISGGFSESCSGVAWPQPPSGHECQLTSSTCTGITCYGQVDLDLVTFNSKTWMDFDPCNYKLAVGVSNKDYTFSLLRNYTWGELKTVEFGTVFRVNYAIVNNNDNETFVLDFSLSICKDSNVSNCAEIVFLEGTEVPQPSCFTQNTWTPTQGGVAMQPADAMSFFQNAVAVSPVATDVFREATMRYMGLVGVFPEGDTCTGNTMGWTGQNLCGDTTLPSLPGDTSCTVSEECYRMDCCMTLDICSIWEVRPNFHVNFDPCTYSLSVGMGTWTSDFNLYQYTWGQTKTLTIGTLLTFSYKIEKSDEDSAFLMDFAFRLSCDGTTTTTNIALMEGTKVPYKTDCEAVVLPDTMDAFLTEQGGQVEKAGQDYVMRGLGLANTFAGHSCTHQTDGWQGLDSYPENIQLPALPDSVNCELNDVWIGVSCCMDFDLKVATYSTGVMFAFDPCTFTLTASLGGTTFTELDMYRYTWGTEESLTVGQEIQLNYTINYNKDTQEYTLSFSVTTCVDSCTAPLPIFSQTTISLPTCMDQVSVLPGAGTIQDLVTQYGDTLGDAALQPAYRYWGLFDDLYPLDTCIVPATSPSCDLDLSTLNLPDAYTYSLHDSCTGIESCVECDLQVVQRSSKVAVDIDGCAMTMTLTFATLTKVIRLYEVAWDQEQVWLLGTLYQIKYTISNDVASGNYQIDLEVVTCLDPDSCQSCGHVMQNSIFPKPTCDSDENCELDPSTPGQTFTAYLGSFPSDVTAEAATAGLENVYRCQRVPDMIMETCSAPPVDTPTCDWSPALSNGCYHTDGCSGVTCCIDFNYQIITKGLDVRFDIDECTYSITVEVGSESTTHLFWDFAWGEEQAQRIGKAFYIRYTVHDEGTHYRVSYFIAQCLDDRCDNGWDVLDSALINKRGCNDSCTDLQLPGDGSISGFATNLAGVDNDYALQAVYCKLGIEDYWNAEQSSLQPTGVSPAECSASFPDVPGYKCVIMEGCLGFTCTVDVDFKVRTWPVKMGISYDPATYRVNATFGNMAFEYDPFMYPWGQEEEQTLGDIFTFKYKVDYPAGGDCRAMKLKMELDVMIDGAREPNMPLSLELTAADPFDTSPYILPGDGTVETFLNITGQDGNNLVQHAVYRSMGISDMFCADTCTHTVQSAIPDSCVEQDWDLPSEMDNVTCSYTDQCHGVECCVTVDFEGTERSFQTWFHVDSNVYEISVGLGSHEFKSSVFTFPFGTVQQETIGDVFTLRYNVSYLASTQRYIASMDVRFNLTAVDRQEFDILTEHVFPELTLDTAVPYTLSGRLTEPLGFWPLSEDVGPMDVTNGGNDGVLLNTNPAAGPSGEDGQSVALDGSAQSYIDFPNNGRLTTEGSLTILANINPSTANQFAPIFDYRGGEIGVNASGVSLWLLRNGVLSANLEMQTENGVENVTFQSEANTVNAGEWNSVGVSYDNVTMTAYLWKGGAVVGQLQTPEGKLVTDGPTVRAGYAAMDDGTGFAFSGNLACVQVWNLSLTGQQVGEATNFCPYSGSFSITAWPETVTSLLQDVQFDPTSPNAAKITQAVFRHFELYSYLDEPECNAAALTVHSCPDIPLVENDVLYLPPLEQCNGIQGCVTLDFGVRTYSFDVSFYVGQTGNQLHYSIGGHDFTVDLFFLTPGVHTRTLGNSIEIKWSASIEELGTVVVANFDLYFTIDNHLVIYKILDNARLPNNAVGQANSAADVKAMLEKVKSFPASVPQDQYVSFIATEMGLNSTILRDPAMWGTALVQPTFTTTCPLKILAEAMSEQTNGMVTCIALEHCVGIKCNVQLDLEAVEPVIQISLKIQPCLPDVSMEIGFEKEDREISFITDYYIGEGPLRTIDFGDHIKLQYSVLRGPDQTFVTNFTLLMCVNNICAVRVPILDGVSIPRPPYCTRRRRSIQVSEEGMTLLWTSGFKPATINSEINGLETQAQQCMGTLDGKLQGESCPGLPPMFEQHKLCQPHRNCRGISCCVHLDPDETDLMSHVSLDMETCGRHLTIRVGKWSFKETIPKAHTRYQHGEKIGDALQVIYSAINPDDHRVVVDLKLRVCDHETAEQHCHVVVILKEAVIPLFGCRQDQLIEDSASASHLRYKRNAAERSGKSAHPSQGSCPSERHLREVEHKLHTAYRKQQERIARDAGVVSAPYRHHRVKRQSANEAFGIPALNTPFLLPLPTNVTVMKGLVATLSCEATSATPLTFQWAFNGQLVDTSLFGYELTPNGTLKVKNAQPTNAGTWTCMATNQYGTTTRVLTLNVVDGVKDMTLLQIRFALDLNNIDPVVAVNLMEDLKNLYSAMLEEAIDLLLNGGSADLFSSFDIKLEGFYNFPRRISNFFKYEIYMLVGGILPMTFRFGADGYYGMDCTIAASLMNQNMTGGVTPYIGIRVWGELAVGAVLYGKLRLEGDIMEVRFPTQAEIGFSKFPFDVGMKLDLELIPLKLKLMALVTVEVNLLVGTITETLFKADLWKYTTPKITMRILDLSTKEEDNSPPEIESVTADGSGVPAQTRECNVDQVVGYDYAEPAYRIEIVANDDRSQAKLKFDVGTVPGGTDVVSQEEIGNSPVELNSELVHGVPLYFTVHACNNAGGCATATCSLPTLDNTLPSGRVDVEYLSTSNPQKLSATAKLFDDSELTAQRVGLGYGHGVWGDQITPWQEFTLTREAATEGGLASFTPPRLGRLAVEPFKSIPGNGVATSSPESCAAECLKYLPTQCKGFNFDYGESKDCELNGQAESMAEKGGARLEVSGRMHYYERFGYGHNAYFLHEGLSLEDNSLYYFNVESDNFIGYTGEISSAGVLTDFTHPNPGYLGTDPGEEELLFDTCEDLMLDGWEQDRCGRESDRTNLPQHRVIRDAEDGRTVFNGMRMTVGGYHTRANTFIAANWDGFHDDNTGLFGYSWAVGLEPCVDMIHPHIDPHAHLYDASEWTHSGSIFPIPPIPGYPDGILLDAKYYITVRAINNVAFGGALITSVCHTAAYGIDNTPPDFHEITEVTFTEEEELYVAYNASDLQSDIKEADIGLGLTKFDVLVMNWVRHNYTGSHEHGIAGDWTGKLTTEEEGVPFWPKLRVINGVDLRGMGVAESPIVMDNTPPIAGNLFDGSQYGRDMNWTMEQNEVCANWKDFYDPESGISKYMWGVGSFPGGYDLVNLTKFTSRVHQTCMNLDEPLVHNSMYYNMLIAYHGGFKKLSVTAVSNGARVDLTPPEAGWIVDGTSEELDANGIPMDEEFTSEQAIVGAIWGDFVDPESGIDEFMVSVYRRQRDSDGNYGADQLIHGPDDIDRDEGSVVFYHFHLLHADIVTTKLTAINVAGGVTEADTDSFIVDLTPPVFDYLVDIWDGDSDPPVDRDYQTTQNSLSASWGFEDLESGLDHYKAAIFETFHGTRQQIVPTDEPWKLLYPASLSSHTESGLSMSAGAMYQTRVGAVNRATLTSVYQTDGVVIDPSPPAMQYIRVGVLDGSAEEKIDGYVRQADPNGIQASWLAVDGESGIQDYWVSVGTSAGADDLLPFTNMGSERAAYISDLTLPLTDWNTNVPVYYVTAKARNGAGSFSTTITSSPIFVVDEDRAGYVTDGPEENSDLDYQRTKNILTGHFAGFESQLHGIVHFLWAVGTSSGEDDIQPFLSAGIILKPEDQVRGGGLGGSGKARAILSLDCGVTYYLTVRAITGYGNILESYSDGLLIDCSPPTVDITSIGIVAIGEDASLAPGTNRYQLTSGFISAAFDVTDDNCPVSSGWYQFGTTPYGSDILSATPFNHAYRSNKAGVRPAAPGIPNILTVYGSNVAGLTNRAQSGSVVIDNTPPVVGTVNCPSYMSAATELRCSWEFFLESESNIVSYSFMIGTKQGLDDTFASVSLDGYRSEYRATGLTLQDQRHYFATVIAYNSVGLRTAAYSGSIIIDATPPTSGVVVEVSGLNTFNYSTSNVTYNPVSTCSTEEECAALDAVCQQSVTQVTAAWTTFSDPESSIDKYEYAVGTTPGGGQLREYTEVPSGVSSLTVMGLDLMQVQQVFVSIKAYNLAGLTTVAISNGVYISLFSAGLTPMNPAQVFDGPVSGTDLDYQTSLDELQASWDFSGDPCPIVQYEWSIRRVDETLIQDFTDTRVRTESSRDGLEMTDGETYYSVVRATNVLGNTWTVRSDGITVQREPLVPGVTRDGKIIGYDLSYQASVTELCANWDNFGASTTAVSSNPSGNPQVEQAEQPEEHRAIDYYIVSVGTDRTSSRTRDNIVAPTNVGLNKTVCFYHLTLDPGDSYYYVNVQAYGKNFAPAEATSNGIRVGYDSGVIGTFLHFMVINIVPHVIHVYFPTAGNITVSPFINSNNSVLVLWEGFQSRPNVFPTFTSQLAMRMFLVGVGRRTDVQKRSTAHEDAQDLNCQDMIDENSEVYQTMLPEIFTVMPWTMIEKDTFYKAENLTFEHDGEYFVVVVGVDEAGECEKTMESFEVDLTDPVEGYLRVGPLLGQEMVYSRTNEYINVFWGNYSDPESDIDHYEVGLFKAVSCAEEDEANLAVEVDWIIVNNTYRTYTLMPLDLQGNIPYYVRLRAVNAAGTTIMTESPPILYDTSEISEGTVVDGWDYFEDQDYHGDPTSVQGMFLHLADPSAQECPERPSPFTDGTWNKVTTDKLMGMYTRTDIYRDWKLTTREKEAEWSENGDDLVITMIRSVQSELMYSGCVYRNADIQIGGTYKVSIKAAEPTASAVTSVVFWDGPDGTCGSSDMCDYCCNSEDETILCPCDCYKYSTDPITTTAAPTTTAPPQNTTAQNSNVTAENISFTAQTTTAAPQRSTPVWAVLPDPIEGQTSTVSEEETFVTQGACGMLILPNGNENSRLIMWCTYFEDKYEPKYKEVFLNFDPSAAFYNYEFIFTMTTWEELSDWTLSVFIDGEQWAMVSGLPSFTNNTKLMFNVLNENNDVPVLANRFKPDVTTASFRNVVLPPASDIPCRYGRPFRGNIDPIIKYYAGVLAEDLDDGTQVQVVDFREIYTPCLPCLDDCSRFACDPQCNSSSENVEVRFSLDNLNLTVTDNGTAIPYFLIVKALSASGSEVTTITNGFTIDTTPPNMESSIHVDVMQGELMPTSYQQSNDTIKAVWYFSDEESGIKENCFAIGSRPNGTDLQNYTCIGVNATGINSDLEGLIENNRTYFVSIMATNKAGLTAYGVTGGVTALLEPPSANVNTSALGCTQMEGVDPPTAMQASDPTEVGISYGPPEDPSINKTMMCVQTCGGGGDTVPCIQIGLNGGGSAAIVNGQLIVSNMVVANISDLPKPADPNCLTPPETNDTSSTSLSDTSVQRSMQAYMNARPTAASTACRASTTSLGGNTYNVPPGSCTMNCLRMCNPANLCVDKCDGPIVTLPAGDTSVSAAPGQRMRIRPSGSSNRKRRSTPSDYELSIEPTGDLPAGVTLAFGELDQSRVSQEYGSDASDDYVPYITDPELTIEANLTGRYLRDRIKTILQPSFYLSVVGQVELNASLAVTSTVDPAAANWTDDTPLLIFWNKDLSEWDDASRTCDENGQMEFNETSGELVTYVCSTNYPTARSQRTKRSTSVVVDYFSRETQFAVVIAAKGIPNDPPVFTSTLDLWMEEDGGTLAYWIQASDPDSDEIVFGIDPSSSPALGTATLSGEGLLTYKPFSQEFGIETINIYVREVRADSTIIPILETTAVLSIEVLSVNDYPVFSVEIGGQMLVVQENNTIVAPVEQNLDTNIMYEPYQIVVSVWDPDVGETLLVDQYNATFGTAHITLLEPDPSEIPAEGSYIKALVTYVPIENFYGHDEFILLGIDAAGAYSERLIFDVYILHMPCINNATCKGIEDDWNCTHTKRADGYDGYECECLPGWVGRFCETDFDDCVSSPCPWPKECHDELDYYRCECPDWNPNCDGLQPWEIALIVCSILALVVVGLIIGRVKYLRKHQVQKLRVEEDEAKKEKTDTLPPPKRLPPVKMQLPDEEGAFVMQPNRRTTLPPLVNPSAPVQMKVRGPGKLSPRRNSVEPFQGAAGIAMAMPSIGEQHPASAGTSKDSASPTDRSPRSSRNGSWVSMHDDPADRRSPIQRSLGSASSSNAMLTGPSDSDSGNSSPSQVSAGSRRSSTAMLIGGAAENVRRKSAADMQSRKSSAASRGSSDEGAKSASRKSSAARRSVGSLQYTNPAYVGDEEPLVDLPGAPTEDRVSNKSGSPRPAEDMRVESAMSEVSLHTPRGASPADQDNGTNHIPSPFAVPESKIAKLPLSPGHSGANTPLKNW